MTAETRPGLRTSPETKAHQIELAKAQGEALGRALEEMTTKEAHGKEVRVGDYLVAVAVEKAEGLWTVEDGEARWTDPRDENCHIEVCVRSAADGRFLPGLDVEVTVLDEDGREVGTHEQPFLWHPWLYHYGRNWRVPGEGRYTLRVHVEPPRYARHDKVNGRLFLDPVDATFEGVRIQPGRKKA